MGKHTFASARYFVEYKSFDFWKSFTFLTHAVVSFPFQGLTPIDIAEPEIEKYLEELKKKQMEKPKINVCIALFLYVNLHAS